MTFGAIFKENLRISISSIKSTKLRTSLTVLIIALGIMALVGILTAIEAIKGTINKEFADMGASTFTISSRGMRVSINGTDYRTKTHSYISQRQAVDFQKKFNFPAYTSISVRATGASTIKFESKKTNPNIAVLGIDDGYLRVNGMDVEKGRNMSANEVADARNVCLVGKDIVSKLFTKKDDPIDKVISVGSGKYRIIGVLKSKGSGFGGGTDRSVLLPYTNVAAYFSYPKMNYTIAVQPYSPRMVDAAQGEAEGVFRQIRRLSATDETDFNIVTSDNLAQLLIKNIGFVTIAATLIGVITLVGAAVGLMNIMLVTVAERTREIGTRKAIGARSALIKQQFLFEAILICQIGGLLGVILGILVGNVVSIFAGTAFIIPWGWLIGGLAISFVVGLISGYLPAVKASKLDPIEALRYE